MTLTTPATHRVAPGGTVGILGGGQLGRMLAIAAAQLGLKAHIFCPEADCPAGQVSDALTVADYDDENALHAFGNAVQVVTYEFENVPAATAAAAAHIAPLFPGARALEIAQDRLHEKDFLSALTGVETAPYRAVADETDLANALEALGTPAIVKTRRHGYDGKGQQKLESAADVPAAWQALNARPAIAEGFVKFEKEISVITTRDQDGTVVTFDVAENEHENHILKRSLVPARISDDEAGRARAIAKDIATALDYVGVLAVEMFLMRPKGSTPRIVVNEIAPRVHNSGHWTQDACMVGQFEQHIRAVCGWPLGNPTRHHDVEMHNLLGDEVLAWSDYAAETATAVHLYGKAKPRPGRKMGHITRLKPLGSR